MVKCDPAKGKYMAICLLYRGDAVAAAQMAAKSAATSDAPPISPPSISGCANSSPALPGFTLPP